DNARLAERAQKLEPAPATQGVAQAPAAPAQRPSSNVERAALAAIAAAVETPQQAPIQPASYGDVTVRPIAQKPTLFPDHGAAAAARSQAAAYRRPANGGESRASIGVRKTPGTARFGRPWPPGTCCPGATGRRPS